METFIASGNVAFKTRARNSRTLEGKIGKRLRQKLGYDVAVFVRTGAELAKIVSHDPFRRSKPDALTARNIILLSEPLDDRLASELKRLKISRDEFHVRGREIYWSRRRQRGKPFSTVPLEKVLRRPFTVRSLNTVERIAMKYFSLRPV